MPEPYPLLPPDYGASSSFPLSPSSTLTLGEKGPCSQAPQERARKEMLSTAPGVLPAVGCLALEFPTTPPGHPSPS